eukprot:396477-Rhodomonas_salina.1
MHTVCSTTLHAFLRTATVSMCSGQAFEYRTWHTVCSTTTAHTTAYTVCTALLHTVCTVLLHTSGVHCAIAPVADTRCARRYCSCGNRWSRTRTAKPSACPSPTTASPSMPSRSDPRP